MARLAIIVAAGSSRRLGFDKLTADLAGSAVLVHSLRAFELCPQVDHVVVVAAAQRKEEFRLLAEDNGIKKLALVVAGGAERGESVCKGIEAAVKAFPDVKIILVHDGARPLISPQAISRCIAAAEECGAASLALRVTDTLKRADTSAAVIESVDREDLWRMETPQAFAADLILKASRAALEDCVVMTDEVSAVQHFDKKQRIQLVENNSANPKITVAGDLLLAESLLNKSV